MIKLGGKFLVYKRTITPISSSAMIIVSIDIFTNRYGSSNLQLMLAARYAGALNNQDGFVNSSCFNAGEALGLVCKILIAKAAGGT
jgi:hypothetical protein